MVVARSSGADHFRATSAIPGPTPGGSPLVSPHDRRTAVRPARPRPDPRAGRPARRDDARRPGGPGDQGRVPGAATTPAAGGRRSSATARTSGESTYFLSANRNKESLVLDLKDRRRTSDVLARLVERADVLMENFRTGVLDRLGFPVSRLHELNPRPGGAVDHRLRPRRAGGGRGRLRPDRAGRGRPDVDHRRPRSRPRSGVPIADLLAGMNGAYGVLAALHERHTHRPRAGRAHLAAGAAWSACTPSRARAGPSPARSPGLAGDHHPAIAPYGLFETGDGADPDRVRLREPVARAVRGARAATPTEPRFATNRAAGGAPRRAGRAARGDVRRPTRRSTGWRCSPRPACPSGKVRTLDDVYAWEQTRSQGLLLDGRPPDAGGAPSCPARRSASTTSPSPAAGPARAAADAGAARRVDPGLAGPLTLV